MTRQITPAVLQKYVKWRDGYHSWPTLLSHQYYWISITSFKECIDVLFISMPDGTVPRCKTTKISGNGGLRISSPCGEKKRTVASRRYRMTKEEKRSERKFSNLMGPRGNIFRHEACHERILRHEMTEAMTAKRRPRSIPRVWWRKSGSRDTFEHYLHKRSMMGLSVELVFESNTNSTLRPIIEHLCK
jgi:hypothetical protein